MNSSFIFSQDFQLSATSLINLEQDFLNKIEFIKKHKTEQSLKQEIFKIHNYIKNEGYFTATIDSITNKKNKYNAYFTLNEKVEKAVLNRNLDTITININELQNKLEEISSSLDNEGKSFSKVRLTSIKIKKKTLYAELAITESKKRKFNKIFVKGYSDFPKSFLKNYFKIRKDKPLSKKVIQKISDDTKNLSFIKEIKSPEILFTKDSTSLYLYFNKQSNNSVDAIVNFASQENGNVLFNGNVDLQLFNILNTGEEFKLFWNSIENERQEFKLSSYIPYVFNSPISPKIEFSLYRQDSTFTNTNFNLGLNYDINSKLKISLYYSNETSENLQNMNNKISSYKSNFAGFNLSYNILKADIFRNKKLFFEINPTFGQRNGETENSQQIKIRSKSSYLWELNQRSSVYIKNETGILNSDQYFTNELYRIGGINSIRGFNEQSIFTRNYTFFNFEYRFLTSATSYLYSVSDIGFLQNENNENLIGLGMGYLFISNKSKINLSLVVGKTSNTNFDFNNTKLAVGWVNYF